MIAPFHAVEFPCPANVIRHTGRTTPEDREALLGQRGQTIWLTGLSASGKSTLSFALEHELLQRRRPCYVLDGDNLRHGISRNLGFSHADRSENIRRVAEVSRLMNDAGLIVISAFISPFRDDRERAREIIGADRFIEVYLSTPLSVCESRDPKGLYQRARAGSVAEFTGISSPYEAPESPALVLDTSVLDVSACVVHLVQVLRIS